jgi:hypothetical protein
MQQPMLYTPEAVLRGYFSAKDENRPPPARRRLLAQR